MSFRDRLLATIRAARPVLEAPGAVVVGSEVPNLLEAGAAATLVVSQDLDVAVLVAHHGEIKGRLDELHDFHPSPEEPSVWLPRTAEMLELNFVGMDPAQEPGEAYLLEDDRLPLLVFGGLGLIRPGKVVELEGTRLVLPRPSGLILEKLITDRSGVKGERDLLVVLGLLATSPPESADELEAAYRSLDTDLRHAVRSNLTILSLLRRHDGMPDPAPWRERIATLLARFEAVETSAR